MEGRSATAARSSSPAAWPRRTASSSASGRRTSTSCSARTTSTAPPSCSTRPARSGPSPRSSTRPCSTTTRCSRRRCRRAARRPTTRGSRSRSAATTLRVLHRAGGARRGDQPPVRRRRRRGRSARRRGRHRGHAARPERQLLRPRPAAGGPPAPATPTLALRPLFADLLAAVGAVDGIRRVRFTSPHPKDMRPETFAAMAETPAVCEHLHYPLQSGSDRVLAAMHRGYTAERYLERLADGRAARRRPRRVDRHHRRLPRRDRRRLRSARSRSPPRPSTTTPTRSSSRPGPAPRRPTMTDRFVDPARRRPSASSGCGSSSSAARWPAPRPASAASRRSSSRARARRTRRCSPAAPGRTSSSTSRRRRRCAPARYADGRDHRAPRRTTSPGRFVELLAEPAHKRAHPRRRRCDQPRPPRRRRSGRRRRASRDVAMAARRTGAGHRDRRRRRDAGLPGDGHRHRQAVAGRAGRGAAPLPRPRRPADDFTVAEFQAAPTTALTDIAGRGQRALLVGRHRALPARSSTDPSTCPGSGPTCAPSSTSEPRRRRRALHARLADARPAGGGQDRADQPPPRRAGARGDARQRPAVQLVRARARRLPADRRSCSSACAGRARCWPSASSSASHAMIDAGLLDEVARARAPAGLSRTAAPGARLQGAARPPRRRVRRSTRRSTRSSCAPASSPCARSGGSVATRAYAGSTSTDDPVADVGAGRGDALDAWHDSRSPSTTASATTSSSCSTRTSTTCRRSPGGCATGAAASAPTACWSARAEAGYAARMVLFNADGSRAEMSGNGIRCFAQALAARRGDLDAAAHPHRRRRALRRRCTPPTTRHDRGQRSTWAPVEPIDEPAGWHRHRHRSATARSPTSASATRTPSSASTTSRVVDLLALGRQVPAHQPRDRRARARADAITMRVHERGAGITEACGTGACASGLGRRVGGVWSPPSVGEIVVHMDGGDAKVRLHRPDDRARHPDRSGHASSASIDGRRSLAAGAARQP